MTACIVPLVFFGKEVFGLLFSWPGVFSSSHNYKRNSPCFAYQHCCICLWDLPAFYFLFLFFGGGWVTGHAGGSLPVFHWKKTVKNFAFIVV
jgi:hypothetical protein